MESKIEIRKIEFGTYEYRKQLELRNEVLKKTIGLVIYGEELAKNLGYKRILLNSRKTAVSFYEKHGYRRTNEDYIENGIYYFKMEKGIEQILFNNDDNAISC